MWKKSAPLLVVLSAALNAAFIGGWAVHAAKGRWITSEKHDQACGGVRCPLHRSLDVTPEQWQQLEPCLARFQQDSETLCQDISRRCGELVDLLAAPQPDQEAIAAKQEEILAGQRKMQERVIAHLLAEKQTLTMEQQAKLFQLIREKTGCARRNPMMGPLCILGTRPRLRTNSGSEP